MVRWMAAACVLAAFCNAHAGSPLAATGGPPGLLPEQRRVIAASVSRREALNRRDIGAASRYIMDDCVFSDDNGSLSTKSEYLQHFGTFPASYDQTSNPRDYVVRIHGSTAVLNFRVTDVELFGDTQIFNEQRRTETWLKVKGVWRMAAAHWGNLPLNFGKSVAADPGRFADYVGRYEWRPGDIVDEVLIKDGKLWSKVGDEIDEYLALGGEEFFIRPDLGSVTFTRDARNVVIGYVYRRSDGQKLFARKLV